MSHGDIEGNWYQKRIKGLNLLAVKSFPEMRRTLLRESFFSCFSGLPVKYAAGVWQSWGGLLWLYDESLLVFGCHYNKKKIVIPLLCCPICSPPSSVQNFWLEGGNKLMQFQVSLQLFKNCCQSNPTLARTKETSHYLIVFLISVAVWGNIYGVVRMLHSYCTISTMIVGFWG